MSNELRFETRFVPIDDDVPEATPEDIARAREALTHALNKTLAADILVFGLGWKMEWALHALRHIEVPGLSDEEVAWWLVGEVLRSLHVFHSRQAT